jgi:phage terminase large subunit
MDSIKFSKKYLPLFQLLNAKKIVEELSFKDLTVDETEELERMRDWIRYPQDFNLDPAEVEAIKSLVDQLKIKHLTEAEQNILAHYERVYAVDTVLMSGGRDSGKTFGLGCFVGVATSEHDHRILYTRQTMSSTKNSIVKALENRLELLGIDDLYSFANDDYNSKIGKGQISITGQKTSTGTQTAKLKSIEDYSIFITDEGEELQDVDDWKKIKRSIRAQDLQCVSIISFNPPTKSHFLFEEFYSNVPEGFNGIIDNVMYIHTTYLDNGQDNMAPHNWREYERLRSVYEFYLATPPEMRIELDKKIIREYKEYRNTILGSFRDLAEGVIFEITVGDYEIPEYGEVIGADQGFTHATAFVKVNVDSNRKKVFLKEIYYDSGKTTDEIFEAIKEEAAFTRIWCDSAVPLFIKDLYTKGLNIKAVKKPKIYDSVTAMLNYEIIVDRNSLNLINEFKLYRWNDKKKEEPIDANNDAIDAARYAITMKLKESIAQPL